MYFNVFIFFLLWISPRVIHSTSSALTRVTDDEFINLTSSEKYIIVLFTKPDCDECDAIEEELLSIRQDLTDTLNSRVVKIYNSNLVQLYDPTKEPALVFFRHGVPLLYHGDINDELILHTFTENREPSVRELDDNNFEHLTQAATGTTTGDWFVMFYSKACVTSRRLAAKWEAVGAALKTRLNVARVDKVETGAATAQRFAVYTTPSFILFHHGNMYRYNLPSHEIESFVHFATTGYKKIAKSEPVPLPKTPFDNLTQMVANYLAENNWLFGVGGFSLVIGLVIAIWSRSREDTTQKKKKKNKKKKKDDD